jgi:hypothetical protein
MSYSKSSSENASLKEHAKTLELQMKKSEKEREANHEMEVIKVKGMVGEIINLAFEHGDDQLADMISQKLINLSLK